MYLYRKPNLRANFFLRFVHVRPVGLRWVGQTYRTLCRSKLTNQAVQVRSRFLPTLQPNHRLLWYGATFTLLSFGPTLSCFLRCIAFLLGTFWPRRAHGGEGGGAARAPGRRPRILASRVLRGRRLALGRVLRGHRGPVVGMGRLKSRGWLVKPRPPRAWHPNWQPSGTLMAPSERRGGQGCLATVRVNPEHSRGMRRGIGGLCGGGGAPGAERSRQRPAPPP